MMMKTPMLQRLMTMAYSRLFSTRIFYISDNAGWSFDWDIHYIQHHLKSYAVPAQQIQTYAGLRGHILHFWDRYHYLSQPMHELHRHNRVLLTWFHGSMDDPAMANLFEQLRGRIHALESIITANQTSRQNLIAAGIPDKKIVVIPLGVDTAHFKPPMPQERAAIRAKLGVPDGAFCIGSFQKDGSGWGDGDEPKLIKGPDIFLEVVARLHQQQPNLFIVLTGPARGYVKKGLEQLGIAYSHHFVDDYPALKQYYHALDAYLITSRDEGGPKGLLESWAAGVPVVSTKMGMPADWLEHGKNGMMAEVNATDKLAQYLHRLRSDAGLQVRLINGGLQTVQSLDWSVIVKNGYVPLYQKMLSQKLKVKS